MRGRRPRHGHDRPEVELIAAATRILGDYLVAELAEGVAGQYIGKLLADAGAEVIKLEPPGGNALRDWSAANVPGTMPEPAKSGGSDTTEDGAFFQYLNTSKHSITASSLTDPAASQLLAAADIIIEDRLGEAELKSLLASRPEAVITSISPYGRNSPDAHLPATEFTLQARAGGVGKRGRLENPPVHAGGRIGEWMAGISGAVGTLAAAQRAKDSGQGEHVDVSVFEGLVIATNIYSFLLASLSGVWEMPTPYRNLEMPSIEPTADGYVGFCTMAQQQFQDFLVLIGAPEWGDDPKITSPVERWANRDLFYERVHAWTKPRTTEEIIEAAAALRIPVASIGNGAIVPQLEAFEGRNMFVDNPSGGFLQPRRPYQIHGVSLPEFAPAPQLGQTTAGKLERLLAKHAASAAAPSDSDAPAPFANSTATPPHHLAATAAGRSPHRGMHRLVGWPHRRADLGHARGRHHQGGIRPAP